MTQSLVKISFFLPWLIATLAIGSGCGIQTKTPMESQVSFPEEKFSVFQGHLPDGRPVVGNVNKAYRDYARKADYPWCLTLEIALDRANLFENGLPKNEESSIANKFEDDLLTEIRKVAIVHYIGHVYGDEFLDVYVYLDSPENAHKFLQTQVENPVRQFRYEIKEDKEWKTVEPYIRVE